MSRPTPLDIAAFKAEVFDWAARMGVSPKRIQVQAMSRKWGSCSPGGQVSFSLALLQQSVEIRTHVIVHELLHLRTPNHGRLFRALMRVFAQGGTGNLAGEDCSHEQEAGDE